ncbi:MAG: GAF domain-containing protein, partial [Planctomycetota bacterium]
SSKPEQRLTVEDQERLSELILAANQRVDVEFQLATNVETLFEGKLREIETRSNPASGKDKAVIHVRADIDKTKLPSVRIGAEVRAKINCGQRSLGYVLFGDVVEFIQKYFWL